MVEQGTGGRIFGLKPDIDEIAGDGDVVGILRLKIGDDGVEHRAIVNEAPPAPPVQVTGDALAEQIARPRPWQRSEMDVGKMGEGEGHGVM